MLRASIGVGIGWLGLSMLADGVPSLVLPDRLLEAGHADAGTLGAITLVALALATAIQPAAGLLSDRAGRAPVILAGIGVSVGGIALMMLPRSVVAGGVLAIVGAAVAQAGYQPMLPDRITGAWRGRAAGLKNAFDLGGALVGFVVLAALLGSGQETMAMAVLGVTLVAGFAASALVLRGTAGPLLRNESLTPLHRGAFARLVVARFLFLLGIYVLGRFLLLFLGQRLDLDANGAVVGAGMVLAVLALAKVAASIPCGWLSDRFDRGWLVLGGGLLAGAGMALVPAANSMPAIVAAGLLVSFGSAAFGSASWAMLADLAPESDAGRLLGIANLGTAGAAAAAGAFGWLIDATGYGAAFGGAAVCAVTGGAIAWRLARRVGADPGVARITPAVG